MATSINSGTLLGLLVAANFKRISKCCPPSDKFCVSDSWRGNMQNLAAEIEKFSQKSQKTKKLALMRFDPVSGEPAPYPSQTDQYREWHGKVAFLHNPFTGEKRDPRDIGSDPFGLLIEEVTND